MTPNPDNPDTTETRTDTSTQTPSLADAQSSSTNTTRADDAIEHAKSHPVRVALLATGLVAVLMNWVSVTIMGGGGQSAPGIDIAGGQLYLIGILGLAGIEFLAQEYRHKAWLVGGALLSVISIGSMLYIQSRIDQAMAELGIFAGAVDVSLGMGVYLAILVALIITGIGYTNSTFEVGDL